MVHVLEAHAQIVRLQGGKNFSVISTKNKEISWLGVAKLTHRRHELLDDLVEALGVRGDSRAATEVQGKLAQRENIPSSVPTRKINRNMT